MKIIIWGHKLHSHTHSYIHNSYFKAFKAAGYETYWFDNSDLSELSTFDFNNCLFFTEDQAKTGMPVLKTAKYITHHIDTEYFLQKGVDFANVLKLGNYVQDAEKFEKVNEYAFFDKKENTLFQCWATDLLPEEINENNPIKYDDSKTEINYVGSLYGELAKLVYNFSRAAGKDKKKFKHHIKVSDEENKQLIQQSFLTPDFRNEHHVNVGYIPCRAFKNISYGTYLGTNSPHVKKMFGDFVSYSEDASELYELMKKDYKDCKSQTAAMVYVKQQHTFINRVNNLMKLI